MSVPQPDASVWREVGDPLVIGADEGPLLGELLAVKDVYAVAGSRRGAGNPAWLAGTTLETTTAPAVLALLRAGAAVRGIAQTDELAYSLAGTNTHYGTPTNPGALGRISGGSSSGSATAVSLGEATIGLGTDTGGSIRVPAAYQGLFGIRTSHDAISREGVLALAPSFDTVGWLTRDAATLERVGDVLLPPSEPVDEVELVSPPALLALADDDVAETIARWLAPRGAAEEDWPLDDLPHWRAAFQIWQGWEAWREHGDWVTDHLDDLGEAVRGRFEIASRIGEDDATRARHVLDGARKVILDLVGDRVLLLPSAPTVAPSLGDDLDERLQEVRDATMQLTCLAGIAGLPAVSIPLRTGAGLPCGVCLVGPPGRDRDLLALATGWS